MTAEQGLTAEFHDRPKVLARALRAAREQGALECDWNGIDYRFDLGNSKEGFKYWWYVFRKNANPDQYLPEGYVDVEDEQPKEQSPWISVEERLPDHENNVLAVLDGKVCVMAYFSFKHDGGTIKVWGYVYDGLDGEAIYDHDYEPTKWMEIPTP